MEKIEFIDKDYLSKEELVDLTDVKTFYIPMIVNGSIDCSPLVKVGSKVKKNTPIIKSNKIDYEILSPINGVVKEIDKYTYLDGSKIDTVVIEKKGKEPLEKEIDKLPNLTKEEFIERLKKYNVIGMSGTGFTSYIKYDAILSTLIVNAVECEPYITSDYLISKNKYKEIIEIIKYIIKVNNIRNCYIAINEKHTDLIDMYSEYTKDLSKIHIVSVKDIYPFGWERSLVKDVLNLEYKDYPQEKGIVVNSISTIYSIYEVIKNDSVIDKRIITIGGDRVKKPFNAIVKIGTNLVDLIDKIDLVEDDTIKCIAGGTLMGRALPIDDLVVTANLNAILFMDDFIDKRVYPCFRCGKCNDVCPVDIVPILIKDKVALNKSTKNLNPEKCIECGLCSYICPSNIDVRSFVKKAKRGVK